MVSINDFKKVLKTTDIHELRSNYQMRQAINKCENSDVIYSFLKRQLDYFDIVFPEGTNIEFKFHFFLSLILGCGSEKIIDHVMDFLAAYGYNQAYELLFMMQNLDTYFLSKLNYKELGIFLGGLSSFEFLSIVGENAANIKTTYGDIPVNRASDVLDIEKMPLEKREYHCHNVTADILKKYPNLYGAYYYIPQEFRGYLEHSVVIDLDRDKVLDFANDIAVPLNYWKSQYQYLSLLIKGQDFSELNKRINEEMHIASPITLAEIEQVRRRLK